MKYFTSMHVFSALLCFSLLVGQPAYALEQTPVAKKLQTEISSDRCDQPLLTKDDKDEVLGIYKSRGFEPIWSRGGVVNDQSKVLIVELLRSSAHGLNPEYYRHALISRLSRSNREEDLACFDVLLSKAFKIYATDITNGHIRSGTAPEHTLVSPIEYTMDELVAASGDSDTLREFLKTLLTTDDRYVRLVSKLSEFRRIEKLGVWPEIRNLGSSENPASDPEKVRDFLLYTGDLEAKDLGEAKRGSLTLRRAIARFQARHGLDPSQEVDIETIREMALPLGKRIDLIRINLERRRWQNRELGQDFVYINTADQSVRIVKDGRKSGSAKITSKAGQEELPTFTGEIVAVSKNKRDELVLHLKSNGSAGIFGGKLQAEFPLGGKIERNLDNLLGAARDGFSTPAGEETKALPIPIQAYVTYLTVWANKDGSINFRPDVFKRDRDLANLLGISLR